MDENDLTQAQVAEIVGGAPREDTIPTCKRTEGTTTEHHLVSCSGSESGAFERRCDSIRIA